MAKAKTRTQRDRQIREAEARARKEREAEAKRQKREQEAPLRAANAERKAYEAKGIPAAVVSWEDHQGETRYGVRAVVMDAIEYLRRTGGLSQYLFEAVRAHEDDIRLAANHQNTDPCAERIRGSSTGAPGQSFRPEVEAASKRVAYVESRLSAKDLMLFEALTERGTGHKEIWRGIVQRITDETRDEAQTARVRAMAENVADYRQMQRKEAA